jgi:hypothetical protein
LKVWTAAVVALMLAACAVPNGRPNDWAPATLNLHTRMTEAEAIAAIGWPPSRAEESTCGAGTSENPHWPCRILIYDGRYPGRSLRIYEGKASEQWAVNNWTSN